MHGFGLCRRRGPSETGRLARRAPQLRPSARSALAPGERRRVGAGGVSAKHGDWETRCETPPGAAHAAMRDRAERRRRATGPTSRWSSSRSRRRTTRAGCLRVIAPLGVLLPTGLGLKIDNDDFGRMSFVRCLPNGCVAEALIDDKLLDQMESGQDDDLGHLPDPRGGHRRAGRRWPASRTPSTNCLDCRSGAVGRAGAADRVRAELERRGMTAIDFSRRPARRAGARRRQPVRRLCGSLTAGLSQRAGATPVAIAGVPPQDQRQTPADKVVQRCRSRPPSSIARRSRSTRAALRPRVGGAGQRIGALSVRHRQHRARMRAGLRAASSASRSASPAVC